MSALENLLYERAPLPERAPLYERAQSYIDNHALSVFSLNQSLQVLKEHQSLYNKLSSEFVLVSDSLQALKDVKPLLAVSSIDRALALANEALHHIFLTDSELIFSEDDQRFIILTPEGPTDLLQANGGGFLAVISFIFSLFLLIKSHSRRFLLLDEQFTMLSDDALNRFIDFLHRLCDDLQIDILLITHDARISISSVHHAYVLEDGLATKLK